jgi:hypothetical protein
LTAANVEDGGERGSSRVGGERRSRSVAEEGRVSPVSGRSGANIGARIGDTEDAPLKCRLRLDRQRAARGWKSRRKVERSRRGWKNRRRIPESWRGWGFAVMETEPGVKELIAGCTSVFIWKLKGESAVNARAFIFGWGFL